MCRILIAGDSFAADWTVKYPDKKGWPNLLAECFFVKNIAQAGVSEYKIYQQVMSIDNLNSYDLFIICHTSPYRAVTREHPLHSTDVLHQHADLMINDIDYHHSKLKNFTNCSLRAAQGYLKYHYDIDYHMTTYNMFKTEINKKLPKNKTIAINFFPDRYDFHDGHYSLNFSNLQETYPGLMNHLSSEANDSIFQEIKKYIVTYNAII
jgi:hypothetical protein